MPSAVDPIIDRSPEQKRLRVEKLRLELSDLGYSVVTTTWLNAMLDKLQGIESSIALEAAE
jgi:hypothetical protein